MLLRKKILHILVVCIIYQKSGFGMTNTAQWIKSCFLLLFISNKHQSLLKSLPNFGKLQFSVFLLSKLRKASILSFLVFRSSTNAISQKWTLSNFDKHHFLELDTVELRQTPFLRNGHCRTSTDKLKKHFIEYPIN